MKEQEMIARRDALENALRGNLTAILEWQWFAGDSPRDRDEYETRCRFKARRDAALDAILTTLASRTPEGMVMVPREPTPEMIEAGFVAIERSDVVNYDEGDPKYRWGAEWENSARDAWAAMLSASPTPSGAE